MRPLVRRKHPLRESEFGERAHLGNALLRGHARIRWLFGVACRGDIAERQTCVIVRRSAQSIEVGFKRVCDCRTGHRLSAARKVTIVGRRTGAGLKGFLQRSEEHTSELQSLMTISYAGFCLK